MTRRNNHADERASKPTWADVSMVIRALEKEYGGHCEVSFDVEGTRAETDSLWVVAKLWDGFAPAETHPTDVVRSLWPTTTSKEMPSLVFRLLHQLDHAAHWRRLRESGSDVGF